jgi:hypothetical protein
MMSEPRKAFSGKKEIILESYGVKIGISCDVDFDFDAVKDRLKKTLTTEFVLSDEKEYEHGFFISEKDEAFQLLKTFEANGKKDSELIADKLSYENLLELLESKVRITIAEHAVGKVFLHAGVVSVGGKAIVIPAQSYQGKTTLVAELVRQGAVYYSDEYAVLDENGYVHPFPKWLSVRGVVEEFVQTDLPVEEFGGVAGTEPVPVALILITEYKKGARWKPVKLSRGQGIMEILPHTIPIRNKPEFTLNVLNNVAERAIITKTKRAEAENAARLLISFFEKQAFKI